MTNTAESTINLFARRSRVINGPSGSGCGGVYSFSSWEEEDEEEDEEIEDETLLVRLFLDVDKKFPLRVRTGGLLSLFLSSPPPPPPRRQCNDIDDGNVDALCPIIIIFFFFFSLLLLLFFFAQRERETTTTRRERVKTNSVTHAERTERAIITQQLSRVLKSAENSRIGRKKRLSFEYSRDIFPRERLLLSLSALVHTHTHARAEDDDRKRLRDESTRSSSKSKSKSSNQRRRRRRRRRRAASFVLLLFIRQQRDDSSSARLTSSGCGNDKTVDDDFSLVSGKKKKKKEKIKIVAVVATARLILPRRDGNLGTVLVLHDESGLGFVRERRDIRDGEEFGERVVRLEFRLLARGRFEDDDDRGRTANAN